MAPKPEPHLIGAVEDKKAVGGRHKQPGRLTSVSWATIRRIYDIVHAAFWALAVAFVAVVIINIPQISDARRERNFNECSKYPKRTVFTAQNGDYERTLMNT